MWELSEIGYFIGSTNVPNAKVENLVFKDLLHTMDSHFVVPDRSVVGKELNKVLIELKAKIGSFLLEAHKINNCVDIRSKKGMSSSYLGITAHFHSQKNHRMHIVTLAVCRMPSPHTGDNIQELLDQVLNEWEIPLLKGGQPHWPTMEVIWHCCCVSYTIIRGWQGWWWQRCRRWKWCWCHSTGC